MPVLPPTEESTWASSVVGICTKRMPRRTMLAAKPARSPITPPPSATTRSPRSSPISSRRSLRRASTGKLLVASPGASTSAPANMAARAQRLLQRGEMVLRDVGVGDDRALGLADALGNQGAALRASRPWPISTS